MSTIHVLIADPSDIVLEGLSTILNRSKTIRVVATAHTAADARKKIVRERPDVTLLSTGLKGFEPASFMKSLLARNPEERVILLTDNAGIGQVNRLLKSGVAGCCSLTIDGETLRDMIKRAARGERVFGKNISSLITRSYAEMVGGAGREHPDKNLTPREREILQLIVDGYTSQEIASFLFISPRTVETHRSNILHKLELKNTAGLVRYAMEHEELKGGIR